MGQRRKGRSACPRTDGVVSSKSIQPGALPRIAGEPPEGLPCSPGSARSDEVEGGVLRQIAQKFTPCVPRGAGYRDSGHGESIRICTYFLPRGPCPVLHQRPLPQPRPYVRGRALHDRFTNTGQLLGAERSIRGPETKGECHRLMTVGHLVSLVYIEQRQALQ